MKDKDKKDIATFLETLALFAWGLATVLTCAGVWNTSPSVFVKAVAVALLLANGYAVYRKAVLLGKKE